ncbi:DUF5610 domain-containing protein [bacterium]|nr:DUF5610 domain-containing protein [bacterium]
MEINSVVSQNLPSVNSQKVGNSGNGVGNTGPGNQGNDKDVGNAGGTKVADQSSYVKGKHLGNLIPASDSNTYSSNSNGIRQNRNIQAMRAFGFEGSDGNLEQINGSGFSVDIGIDYQVENRQSLYNGITENNIKISIDASLRGQFDSFNLDVAIENREASGYSKLDISISLEMLRQSSPSALIGGSPHRHQSGINPQSVDSLLNLDLDINIQTSNVSRPQISSQDFFDKLAEQTSNNIIDFVKNGFNLALLGENPPDQQRIDDFFDLIKNAIQGGYDAAMGELGELPDEVSQSLEKTLALTFEKLDAFYEEVSVGNTAENTGEVSGGVSVDISVDITNGVAPKVIS